MTKIKITICETLRNIIRDSDQPEVRVQAAEALSMAQRMDRRLKQYKADWDVGFWTEYDDNIFKRVARKIIGKKSVGDIRDRDKR
jgi:hypothetical protein